MTDNTVTTNIDHRGVATISMNRPQKHNAFDDAVIAALRAAFDAIASNDDVRVVVLAAEGKSFSAGGDLGWMKRMAEYDYDDNLADARLLAGMLEALYGLPQPTIARVQGAAYGGAVGLVSCCDMAVASERASFALSEVKIGLVPATISPYVIRAIGERAAPPGQATGARGGGTPDYARPGGGHLRADRAHSHLGGRTGGPRGLSGEAFCKLDD